jgi:exosortase
MSRIDVAPAAPPIITAARWRELAPSVVTGVAFAFLFWHPFSKLITDWWEVPEAGHGLLLGPLAVYLAWRGGWSKQARPQPVAGLALLVGAILLRYVSGLAAELFVMRVSLLGAALGLVVFHGGWRQAVHWWLPAVLLALAVPLPAVVQGSLALPLQLRASRFGAALLEARHVPVELAGNVIHLPGQSLFVTEACSGLRSLTALLSLGVLIGGLWLRSIPGRAFIIVAAIPVAMLLNGLRVFLTGFLAYFVSPSLASGVMHYSEGWVMFIIAFGLLGLIGWGVARGEARLTRRTA